MVSITIEGTSKDSLKGTPIITTFALISEIFIFYWVTEDSAGFNWEFAKTSEVLFCLQWTSC